MPTPHSKRSTHFKRIAWSNRFLTSKHKLVDKKLNSKLIKLLDTTHLKYGTLAKKFGRALKQKELAAYQSRLLNEYCANPQKYLELDVDRLVLTLELTDKDLERLLSDKIIEAYPEDSERILSTKKTGVSGLNNGAYDKHRPRYKKGYLLTLYNDSRRFVHVAIADGVNSGKQKIQTRKVLRIDFVPQRFTDEEIKIVLGKLKYVLTARRWEQLVRNARVTRIDIGLNLYGVMSTFVYALAPVKKNNKCLPDFPRRSLIETTYIQHERRSNHFIVYEKLLKELNTEEDKGYLTEVEKREKLLTKLAITTRLERRFLLNKIDGTTPKVKFKQLAERLDNKLFDLTFVDPMDVHRLSTKQQGRLFRNKLPEFVKGHLSKKSNSLAVNKQWGAQAQSELVQHYVDLICNFESVKTESIQDLATEYEAIKSTNVKQEERQLPQVQTPKLPESVDDQANKIITTTRQRVLVNAGAGAGKTTMMVKRVEHLLDSGTKAQHITFLSYNNESAKDATNRLSQIEGESIECSTFHSWALGIVKKYRDSSNSNEPLCKKHLKEITAKIANKKESTFKFISSLLDTRVNKMCSLADAYQLKCNEYESGKGRVHPTKLISKKEVKQVHKAYKEQKRKDNLVDFNDMVELAYRLIRNDRTITKEVAKSNKHVLLDEAQDSNKLQWSILKLLVKAGTSIFCVGDVAQSIYGFRGASPRMLDKFKKQFDSEPYYITSHYRSTNAILSLTNYVRKQVNHTLPNLVTTNPEGEIPKYTEADGEDELAATIAKLMIHLIGKGYDLENIGILFRERMDKDKNSLGAVKFNKLELAFKNELKNSHLKTNYRGPDINGCLYTMHGAKGMEWQVCIVVDPRFKQSFSEKYEDHLTLAYVSFSRSQKELYVIKSLSGENKFIDHKESEHIFDKVVEYTDSIEFIYVDEL